jgi:hypothetical protein
MRSVEPALKRTNGYGDEDRVRKACAHAQEMLWRDKDKMHYMDGLMGLPAKRLSAPMRILHERLEKLRNSLEECELDVVKEHLDDVLDCFRELVKCRELLENVWVGSNGLMWMHGLLLLLFCQKLYKLCHPLKEAAIHQDALIARKAFSAKYQEAKRELMEDERKYRGLSMHLEQLNEEVERELAEPVAGERGDEQRKTIVELAKRGMEERM